LSAEQYTSKITEDECHLGIQAMNVEAEGVGFILGAKFIKSYYTHFDYKAFKVGFAVAAWFYVELWNCLRMFSYAIYKYWN